MRVIFYTECGPKPFGKVQGIPDVDLNYMYIRNTLTIYFY